jgi:GNAT superfamily N-acetyltransferase
MLGVIRPIEMIKIRPFKSNDARLLKAVRLVALQESPHAFASRYSEAIDLPANYWLDIVQCKGNYKNSKSFIGEDGDKPIAMAACYPESAETFRLIAMWVKPGSRSAGVGSAILNFVESWASDQGAKELVAAVYSNNSTAMGFYSNQGFIETEEKRQSDSGKSIELQLTKTLAAYKRMQPDQQTATRFADR